jgi:hypothetical protein
MRSATEVETILDDLERAFARRGLEGAARIVERYGLGADMLQVIAANEFGEWTREDLAGHRAYAPRLTARRSA